MYKNYFLHFYNIINIRHRFINTIYNQHLIFIDNKVILRTNFKNIIL